MEAPLRFAMPQAKASHILSQYNSSKPRSQGLIGSQTPAVGF